MTSNFLVNNPVACCGGEGLPVRHARSSPFSRLFSDPLCCQKFAIVPCITTHQDSLPHTAASGFSELPKVTYVSNSSGLAHPHWIRCVWVCVGVHKVCWVCVGVAKVCYQYSHGLFYEPRNSVTRFMYDEHGS